MKIAVFHNLPLGGAKRVLNQQLKGLRKDHLVTLFYQPYQLTGHRLVKDFKNFFLLKKLHQQLAQTINQGFDLCLVHPDKLTQAPFLLRFLTIPSIYYCHEWLRIVYEPELSISNCLRPINYLYEKLTRLIRKQIDYHNTRSASLILANSNFTQSNIKSAYGKNAVVCYPGVDTKVFKPTKQNRADLLFVGQKENINGWELASNLNSKIKVIDRQNLSDKELAQAYSKSLCALCLSFNEPFGLVALEAQACQTPILAVKQAGHQETIINTQTGYLLSRQASSFTDKIKQLKQNPKLVSRLGFNGRRNVQKHFTWSQHMQTLNNQIKKFSHET
jgi:glycosyltransferase involved in cell wall biosynthesis